MLDGWDALGPHGDAHCLLYDALGAEHAQEGGGVHCPRANLGVVGLGDGAAVCCPELLELEDYGLEAFWLLGHR